MRATTSLLPRILDAFDRLLEMEDDRLLAASPSHGSPRAAGA